MADGQLFGLIRFHDRPRKESKPFIHHLAPKHHVRHLMILSGDRDIEVQHLAEIVGIEDVRAGPRNKSSRSCAIRQQRPRPYSWATASMMHPPCWQRPWA